MKIFYKNSIELYDIQVDDKSVRYRSIMNDGDRQPIGRLYVQGGERNIDRAKYGSMSLLLPKSATLDYNGKTYRTDADGMYITPALWKVVQHEGVIPDFVQPTGVHDAYMKGEKVKFNGSIYESLIDNNVYSPTAYPQGWRKL